MAYRTRIPPEDGQESVWDYPRPPRLELVRERLRVVAAGVPIGETTRGYRVLETSHPPVYYLSPDDLRMDLLEPGSGSSYCEFKGRAIYYDLVIPAATPGATRALHVPKVAWTYPTPNPAFADIAHHLAFYASRVDECYVGDERVQAQAGDFYGGWITSSIVGPFKGGPGTFGW